MSPIYLQLFLFILVKSTQSQNLLKCESKESCRECINDLECIWCIKPIQIENQTQIHCKHKSFDTQSWCPTDDLLVNPQSSVEFLENKPLTSNEGEVVQIQPQRVHLKLRRGEEFSLQFQYAQASNYPIDLYYIMDLSASMEPNRETLAKLGDKLARTMINITSNFQLGFGSFVDKVDLPFVSTVPDKLETPCKLNTPKGQIICVRPYSFKNHLSLTSDYKQFTHRVGEAKVSGNLDAPEGGFDAIMQAIVCKTVIGWRSQARHLLVFSTDAAFHIAGDGKLAGVIEPNDAKCHMENDNYVGDRDYDYPSVSHINYIARENNINIIFAIAKTTVIDSYKLLSERIENSNVGLLEGNSNNVVNLVLDNYNKIVESVTITSNATNDVEVKIASTCSHPKENGCTNIHVGETVNFTATIKPLECSNSNHKTITLKPEGIDEIITIDLEILCNCPCESPPNQYFIPNSPECTDLGDMKCGVCECHAGYFGKNCECDQSTSVSEDVRLCQNPDTNETCSDLGNCKCGKCECNLRTNPNEKIYGKYCQCDNYSCKRNNGVLCSNRGTCDCGQCKCHAGWAGDSCECPDTNSTCIKPGGNGLICSGHGNCKCGKCECNLDNYRYSGRYCEECPSCPGQRCDELRNCVECQAYKDGEFDGNECRLQCTTFTTELVERIDEDNEDEDVKICRLADKNGCTFIFQYEYLDNKELAVKAAKEKVCIGALNLVVWIASVIGTIVLAGLIALIIWKVCTTIHDRREYARFENERDKMKWHRDDNPLYRQATSTFANPVYNRSSRLSFKLRNSQ